MSLALLSTTTVLSNYSFNRH